MKRYGNIFVETGVVYFDDLNTYVSRDGSNNLVFRDTVLAAEIGLYDLANPDGTDKTTFDINRGDADSVYLQWEQADRLGVRKGSDDTLAELVVGIFLMGAGTSVDEISTDVNFASASNDQLATALAIKTYVDTEVGGVTATQWQRVGTDLRPLIAGDDILLATDTERIKFGDGDTYIYELSDDTLRILVGGVLALQLTPTTMTTSGIAFVSGDTYNVGSGGVPALNMYTNTLCVDIVNELNIASGVTVESILLKDGGITLLTGATVDTIETTVTDDDTHIPTSGAVVDYVAASSDDYVSWNLKTNGVQRIVVVSGGTLDIVGGTNITAVYSAGGVVTINLGGHASTHQDSGSDEIDVTGLDGLLADAQTPLGHQSTHISGSIDVIPVATITNTGLTPVLSNVAAEYFDGLGNWTIPAGTGAPNYGSTTQIPYMNVAGDDFLYSANLVFDGAKLYITSDTAQVKVWSKNVNASHGILNFSAERNASYVVAGDSLGKIEFRAKSTTGLDERASIEAINDGVSAWIPDTKLVFRTSPLNDSSVYDRMTILGNGEVGIGTDNPEEKLHVAGDIVLGVDENYNIIRSVVSGGAIQFGTSSSTWDRNLYLGFVDNDAVFSKVLSIIHQTSDVKISGDFYINSNSSQIYFGASQDGDIIHNGTDFHFRSFNHGGRILFKGYDTGGTDRALIYLDPDGNSMFYNAGVKKFETVAGGVSITGSVEINANSNHLILKETDQSNKRWDVQVTGSDFSIIEFGVAERFHIDHTTGYVGIGTDDPAGELDVRDGTIFNKATVGWGSSETNNNLVLGTNTDAVNNNVISSYLFRTETTGSANDLKLHLTSYKTSDNSVGIYGLSNATFNNVITIDGTNVGIGTDNPLGPLHIYHATAPEIWIDGPAGKFRDVRFYTDGSLRWLIRTTNVAESGSNVGSDFEIWSRTDAGGALANPAFMIKRDTGNVGIGAASSSSYKLYVSGTIYTTGAVTSHSDIRYKTVHGNIKLKWEDYMSIDPFIYTSKLQPEIGREMGFSAQQLQSRWKELVSNDSTYDRLGIRYNGMVAINTSAIQKLKDEKDKEIAELKEEIKKLKAA